MKKIKGMAIALLLIQLTACKDHLPIEGTPEHYALHGVVNDGKTINEIKLFDPRIVLPVRLRFPADTWIGVTTEGWNDRPPVIIRKGYATTLLTSKTFDENKKLVNVNEKKPDATVTIYFRTSNHKATPADYGTGSSSKNYEREIKEWGLIESVRKRGEEIEGRFVYLPIEASFHAKNAEPVWMNCNASGEVPASCHGYFQQRGLSVEFHFDYRLMPQWREIYIGISEFIDGVIVQN